MLRKKVERLLQKQLFLKKEEAKEERKKTDINNKE